MAINSLQMQKLTKEIFQICFRSVCMSRGYQITLMLSNTVIRARNVGNATNYSFFEGGLSFKTLNCNPVTDLSNIPPTLYLSLDINAIYIKTSCREVRRIYGPCAHNCAQPTYLTTLKIYFLLPTAQIKKLLRSLA